MLVMIVFLSLSGSEEKEAMDTVKVQLHPRVTTTHVRLNTGYVLIGSIMSKPVEPITVSATGIYFHLTCE